MSVLPAHPTVRVPSSSLSRLIRVDAGQQRPVEGVRALEPDLLGDRHQQLERAVRDRLVLDQRHHRRDRDAVVGAQRRAVGGEPVAVADERDPPLGRIVRAGRVALAHHVQVALQDEGGRRLAAGRRRHADDEVAPGVLLELEAPAARPTRERARSPAPRARGPRDPRQGLEVRPEGTRLDACQHWILDRHGDTPFHRKERGSFRSRESAPASTCFLVCVCWETICHRVDARVVGRLAACIRPGAERPASSRVPATHLLPPEPTSRHFDCGKRCGASALPTAKASVRAASDLSISKTSNLCGVVAPRSVGSTPAPLRHLDCKRCRLSSRVDRQVAVHPTPFLDLLQRSSNRARCQ